MSRPRIYIPDSCKVSIPKTVFLSSTVHDLSNERDAIHAVLEGYGYGVLRSDTGDISITPHEHTYQTCLKNVHQCDILVCVVGFRFGGVVKGTDHSITQAEFAEAFRHNKKILCFAKKELEKESKLFKDALKNSPCAGPTERKAAFDKLKGHPKWLCEDYRVFQLLSDITNRPRDNWIYFFRDIRDIVGHLRRQLRDINVELVRHASPAYEALLKQGQTDPINGLQQFDEALEPIPGMHKVLLAAQCLHDTMLIHPDRLQTLCDAWNRNIYEIVRRGYRNAEEVASKSGPTVFFSLDTQTDLNSTQVWIRDAMFTHYLRFTGEQARKAGKKTKFVRFIVVFDPERVNTDREYRRSLVQIINTHHQLGIGVGFVRYDVIPQSVPLDFIDLNSIVGYNVNVFSVTTGLAQVIDKGAAKGMVRTYEDLYLYLDSMCRNADRGRYVTEKATTQNVFKLLEPLFA